MLHSRSAPPVHTSPASFLAALWAKAEEPVPSVSFASVASSAFSPSPPLGFLCTGFFGTFCILCSLIKEEMASSSSTVLSTIGISYLGPSADTGLTDYTVLMH